MTTMTFQVDRNTSISGKLAVGANADVSYRTQDGNNIAVIVSVIPVIETRGIVLFGTRFG